MLSLGATSNLVNGIQKYIDTLPDFYPKQGWKIDFDNEDWMEYVFGMMVIPIRLGTPDYRFTLIRIEKIHDNIQQEKNRENQEEDGQ